jgi:hypothetical protein
MDQALKQHGAFLASHFLSPTILLSKIPNVQVSDTTSDARCSNARHKIIAPYTK